jgi:sorbitol-specific phosphotransferase system component IIA
VFVGRIPHVGRRIAIFTTSDLGIVYEDESTNNLESIMIDHNTNEQDQASSSVFQVESLIQISHKPFILTERTLMNSAITHAQVVLSCLD